MTSSPSSPASSRCVAPILPPSHPGRFSMQPPSQNSQATPALPHSRPASAARCRAADIKGETCHGTLPRSLGETSHIALIQASTVHPLGRAVHHEQSSCVDMCVDMSPFMSRLARLSPTSSTGPPSPVWSATRAAAAPSTSRSACLSLALLCLPCPAHARTHALDPRDAVLVAQGRAMRLGVCVP